MGRHRRVVERLIRRLMRHVTRSPLLRISINNQRGRLLDCYSLDRIHSGLSRGLLKSTITKRKQTAIDLPMGLAEPECRSLFGEEENATRHANDNTIRLYDLLDRRMRRYAEQVHRELGIHVLWLGYPLIHVGRADGEAKNWILAPILLWPVSVTRDFTHEGRFIIKYEREAGSATFNSAMAHWINRRLGVQLERPTQDTLDSMTWDDVRGYIAKLGRQLQGSKITDLHTPLEPVPSGGGRKAPYSPTFLNSAVIGCFRWQNEAIQRDLERMRDLPAIGGVAGAFTSESELPRSSGHEFPPEEDRFLVLPSDFSQEEVLVMSRQDPGVVVHGPPGTGKSQTIVNIIADTLGRGQTVLMVCQKQAATEVVYKRMKEVGLEGLCLTLHDAQTDRTRIFKEIRGQVERLGTTEPSLDDVKAKRSRASQEITLLEKKLDAYVAALRVPDRRVGLAYRDLLEKEQHIYRRLPTIRPLPRLRGAIESLTHDDLSHIRNDIVRVGNLFRQVDPLENPWVHGQEGFQPLPSFHDDIEVVLENLRTLDQRHVSSIEACSHVLPLPADIESFEDMAREVREVLVRCCDAGHRTWRVMLGAWLRALRKPPPNINARTKQCHWAARWARLLLRREQYRHLWGFANPCFWYLWLRCTGKSHDLKVCNRGTVPGLRPRSERLEENIRYALLAEESLITAEALYAKKEQHTWLGDLIDAICEKGNGADAAEALRGLEAARARIPAARDLLKGLKTLENYLTEPALRDARARVLAGESLAGWLEKVQRGAERLDVLKTFKSEIESAKKAGGPLYGVLAGLVAYEKDRVHTSEHDEPIAPPEVINAYGEWWWALVEYTAIQVWKGIYEQEHDKGVELYTPETYAQDSRRLRDLLKAQRALNVQVISRLWHERQLRHKGKAWNRMFQIRRSKYGDARRLREAVQMSLAEGLLDLRPCWLVNPASVCQALPLEPGMFDVVIFDEASQCPVEHALPVIYRGKRLVVTGDEKQLPPTSFFIPRDEYETEEMDEEDPVATDESALVRKTKLRQAGVQAIEEAEDLLEACLNSQKMPERMLQVHYRSEHPALIEFSNHAFYEGRLEIPIAKATEDKAKSPPIEFREVGGVYDRRENRAEAETVVRLLRRVWREHTKPPTIGVVTFNQKQRDLIEGLIELERSRDRGFDKLFRRETRRQDSGLDVGFFVKNLENVQGDERDLMIFSATFGRDPDGNFRRLFGPVGSHGGERRLNVAITRAKSRVVVLNSMPIGEISAALRGGLRADSSPKAYLQLYLAYAKAVSERDEEQVRQLLLSLERRMRGHEAPRGEPESYFEEDVAGEIRKAGYIAEHQIGESGFRIDIGVRGPGRGDGYVLGVECDGATYHSGYAARFRDIWREEILRSRGWRIHRVWSTTWWRNRESERRRLVRAIEEATRALLGGNHERRDSKQSRQIA